ncbi:M23 family metallopeptidase [Streptomyces sp. NPDC002537]
MSAAFGNAGGRWARGHTGVDFPAPVGTPVSAAGGGTVVKAGPRGAGDGKAYGNAIVIKHASGTYSQYAHLLRVDVRVGDTVRAGQRIALSGNTGNTSGPHLHFEIRTSPNYGHAMDPVHFLRSRGVSL